MTWLQAAGIVPFDVDGQFFAFLLIAFPLLLPVVFKFAKWASKEDL